MPVVSLYQGAGIDQQHRCKLFCQLLECKVESWIWSDPHAFETLVQYAGATTLASSPAELSLTQAMTAASRSLSR